MAVEGTGSGRFIRSSTSGGMLLILVPVIDSYIGHTTFDLRSPPNGLPSVITRRTCCGAARAISRA
jgi:hypothetical protein